MYNGKGKSILVIGYGRFGRHLATKLQEIGNEVMVVDKDDEVMQNAETELDNIVIGDCRLENTINSLGVSNFDICFVAVGEDFESVITATSLLKNAGATKVVARAGSSMQETLLKKVGADEVIYPERDFAAKLAMRSNLSDLLNYLELTHEYSIYEIKVPSKWVGKSISEVDVMRKHKLNTLMVENEEGISPVSSAAYVFKTDDRLVVLGKEENILRFMQKDK